MSGSARFRCAVTVVAVAVSAAGCGSLDAMRSAFPKTEDVAAQRRGRSAEAAERFDENRDFAEFTAAQALWLEGDRRGAVSRLRRILARSPDHVDARLLLAETLLVDDRPREAVEILRPAWEADPENVELHQTMALLVTAADEAEVDRWSCDERGAGDDSLAWEGDSPIFPAGKSGQSPAGKSGQSPADGANVPVSFEVACDADYADRSEAIAADLIGQGEVALTDGNAELATARFQEATAQDPHNRRIPVLAAVSALRQNRPDVAVAVLEPRQAEFSESASLYRVLGAAYYRQGKLQASQAALERALSLDKSHALSYFLMGCTLAKLGQTEAAESHFREAALIDPKYAVGR